MSKEYYLKGQLLLAMPTLQDGRFYRSVIYICSHSSEGAMGLIINKTTDNIDFPSLLDQLNINSTEGATSDDLLNIIIHEGGPVETGRGFILHSADYVQESTLIISETIALTATVDILKAIASTESNEHPVPKDYLIALGYASWSAGQLEQEIRDNSWLNIEADDALVFHTNLETKWSRAMIKLGVDITRLSTRAGHA